MDEREIDALEIEQVEQVLRAALADDRQDAQLLAVVDHIGHVLDDAHIGAARRATEDADRVLIDQLAILGVGDGRRGRRRLAVSFRAMCESK